MVGSSADGTGVGAMSFYWSEKSVPELRHLPKAVRGWVVQRAIQTLPVTFWSGLLIVAFMLGGGTAGVVAGITLGRPVGWLVAVALCLLIKPLLLNLARPRIRELLERM